MRWLCWVGIVGWGSGCPKRVDPVAQVSERLRAADAAWEQRGELGLDRAGDPLLEAYGLGPHDPRVLWRIARWRVAEGLASEERAARRSSFAEARAIAVSCLEDEPGFAERRAADGWAEALGELSPARRVCIAWAALAWVRWSEVHGAEASALDVAPVEALLAEISREADPSIRSVAAWAWGISLATRPVWAGRDLAEAKEQLRVAVGLDQRSVVRRVDLWRLVVVPSGTEEEARALAQEIRQMRPIGPEDALAQRAVE